MVEIKRSNPKSFQELDLRIKELQGVEAKVGWFQKSKYPNGTPVATAAATQEFGAPSKNIPPRPTARPAIIDNEQTWKNIAAQGARQVLAGKSTGAKVMETLAIVARDNISKNIATLTSPPLATATLRARRARGNTSIKPLEDTGLMSATLTYAVENANS